MKIAALLFLVLPLHPAFAQQQDSDPDRQDRIALQIHMMTTSGIDSSLNFTLNPYKAYRSGFSHYFLLYSNRIHDGRVAFKTRDAKASVAVLRFLRFMNGGEPVLLRVREEDMAFIYPKMTKSFITYPWEKMQVKVEDEWLELSELLAYLRYSQGLFSRDMDRDKVFRILLRYHSEPRRPVFGKLVRCDRLLGYVPFYKPRSLR
jgi:hypothetical protein